ncbi:hypothetical protein Rsub_00369 [Raphidocelis subcapitata]|uniref:Uncharacterized protein n=1 Tax=Raphidocelis subcapitata TaxID=307507 RepID=A0A2V0NK61_9CHLO|nr:hypothetical protein Rsub_00369 [Raphidocelis subcapitata]|eukprot:GBF87658.1 hypothetical protein Rsub_00369 [Raphidocelis subcapitata]
METLVHSIIHAPAHQSDAGSGWVGPYEGAVALYGGGGSSAGGSHGPSVQALQGSVHRSGGGVVSRYEYLLTGEGYVQPPMSFAQPDGGLVKAANRPVWRTPSQKNVEGQKLQAVREMIAFERRANTYRKHVGKDCHHNHSLAGKEQWPFNGGALLKGRAPEAAVLITAETREGEGLQRPASGGSSYAALAASRAAGAREVGACPPAVRGLARSTAAAARGRYDPLRHEWIEPPNPEGDKQRQRDEARALGQLGIRCAPKPLAPPREDAVSVLDAPRGRSRDPAPPAPQPPPAQIVACPARNPITGAGVPAPQPRPVSASMATIGGTPNRAADRWGHYDLLTHECKAAPLDPRYSQSKQEQDANRIGKGVRRVPLTASQGVFDPIRGRWTVPPTDPRRARAVGVETRPASSGGGASSGGRF